ncbi:hypothetical protein PLCT2_00544 [Planctomycetaceae bacterium]|nr:hypothetical protein PLCT2_00544 [Planctomycetaceae bacterium]
MATMLAYFLTFTCYGTWLHGDERSAVDKDHDQFGQEYCKPSSTRKRFQGGKLQHAPILIDDAMRTVIETVVREVCEHRRWKLYAINVRTNHVHIAVWSDIDPERTMSTFKAWATRRMREAGLIAPETKFWTRHGSTRWVNTERGLDAVCSYIRDGQGRDLPKDL